MSEKGAGMSCGSLIGADEPVDVQKSQ